MASSEEDMKKALKAFKKRLKMQQMEEDSRLGRSPLTGSKTTIISIQPPLGFGAQVWQDLADAGYLKRDSGGFFELMPGK